MIAQLSGTVVGTTLTHITVDVGGVGYRVFVRGGATFSEGESVRLFTYLAVRENALDLYGFLTEEELEVFELLLRIPKIGPKSALHILSQAEIDLLKKAVAEDDPSYLAKMSGIGKKSAEKIVLGLKDVFEAAEYSDASGSGAQNTDAIDALIALGYSQKDAREALKEVPEEATDTKARVTAALRKLGS